MGGKYIGANYSCWYASAVNNPITFQKSNSISFTSDVKSKAMLEVGDAPLSIPELTSQISNKEVDYVSKAISPEERVNTSIKQGYGNCSNLSFAFSVLNQKVETDLDIIHFIPLPNEFMFGIGHTVFTYPMDANDESGAIFDSLGGGIRTDFDNTPLSPDRLLQTVHEESDYGFISYNKVADRSSIYIKTLLR